MNGKILFNIFTNEAINKAIWGGGEGTDFKREITTDIIEIGLTTDYDLLRIIPAGTSRETATARQWIVTLVRPDELVEEVYVTDRQLQRVDLR